MKKIIKIVMVLVLLGYVYKPAFANLQLYKEMDHLYEKLENVGLEDEKENIRNQLKAARVKVLLEGAKKGQIKGRWPLSVYASKELDDAINVAKENSKPGSAKFLTSYKVFEWRNKQAQTQDEKDETFKKFLKKEIKEKEKENKKNEEQKKKRKKKEEDDKKRKDDEEKKAQELDENIKNIKEQETQNDIARLHKFFERLRRRLSDEIKRMESDWKKLEDLKKIVGGKSDYKDIRDDLLGQIKALNVYRGSSFKKLFTDVDELKELQESFKSEPLFFIKTKFNRIRPAFELLTKKIEDKNFIKREGFEGYKKRYDTILTIYKKYKNLWNDLDRKIRQREEAEEAIKRQLEEKGKECQSLDIGSSKDAFDEKIKALQGFVTQVSPKVEEINKVIFDTFLFELKNCIEMKKQARKKRAPEPEDEAPKERKKVVKKPRPEKTEKLDEEIVRKKINQGLYNDEIDEFLFKHPKLLKELVEIVVLLKFRKDKISGLLLWLKRLNKETVFDRSVYQKIARTTLKGATSLLYHVYEASVSEDKNIMMKARDAFGLFREIHFDDADKKKAEREDLLTRVFNNGKPYLTALLELARLRVKTKDGQTALGLACLTSDVDVNVVKILVADKGVDVNETCLDENKEKTTPRALAFKIGSKDVVDILKKAKAKESFEESMQAALKKRRKEKKREEREEEREQEEAKREQEEREEARKQQKATLYLERIFSSDDLAGFKEQEIIKSLKLTDKFQLIIKKRDKRKRTPLMKAAAQGFYDLFMELESKGSDVKAQDEDGYTALDFVKFRKEDDLSEKEKQHLYKIEKELENAGVRAVMYERREEEMRRSKLYERTRRFSFEAEDAPETIDGKGLRNKTRTSFEFEDVDVRK